MPTDTESEVKPVPATRVEEGEEELLSRREVARLARVHPNTVKNVWEANGWLTRIEVQVGRQMEVRYSRAEVEDFLKSRRKTTDEVDSGPGERIAALEAENALMRDELARLRAQHEELLQEILRRAQSGR